MKFWARHAGAAFEALVQETVRRTKFKSLSLLENLAAAFAWIQIIIVHGLGLEVIVHDTGHLCGWLRAAQSKEREGMLSTWRGISQGETIVFFPGNRVRSVG